MTFPRTLTRMIVTNDNDEDTDFVLLQIATDGFKVICQGGLLSSGDDFRLFTNLREALECIGEEVRAAVEELELN